MWISGNDGKHSFISSNNVIVPRVLPGLRVATGATTLSNSVSVNVSVATGEFVQYAGGEAIAATPQSICIGVCETNRTVVRGVTNAWVVTSSRKLALSGIYDKTINGVPSGKTVVIITETKPDGKTPFILAKTVDDEVSTLTARMDALTGSG